MIFIQRLLKSCLLKVKILLMQIPIYCLKMDSFYLVGLEV